MGLTIDNFPVYGGAADISGVYAYVRDIRTTKNSNSTHDINFVGFYEVDVSGVTQRLETRGYFDTSSNVYSDSWSAAYDVMKASLDSLSLTYVNS